MYRKELALIICVALSIFLAMDFGSLFLVKLSKREAKYLATETYSGVSLVQQAIDRMQRNWSETCRLINVAESKRVAETIEKINSNSTSSIWESYALQVERREEEVMFEEMMLLRSEFLELRKRYFQVLLSRTQNDEKYESPKILLLEKLLPAYEAYLAKSFHLMQLRFAAGLGQSQEILRKTTLAEYTVFGSIISTLIISAYVAFQMHLGNFRTQYRE
jgi:hypothetical protein